MPAHILELARLSPGVYGRAAEAWEVGMRRPGSPQSPGALRAQLCTRCHVGSRGAAGDECEECGGALLEVELRPEEPRCVVPLQTVGGAAVERGKSASPGGQGYEGAAIRDGSAFASAVCSSGLVRDTVGEERFRQAFPSLKTEAVVYVGGERFPLVEGTQKFMARCAGRPTLGDVAMDRNAEDVLLERLLGEGTHGTVFQVRIRSNGQIYALKTMAVAAGLPAEGGLQVPPESLNLYAEYLVGNTLREYNLRRPPGTEPLAMSIPECFFFVRHAGSLVACMAMPVMLGKDLREVAALSGRRKRLAFVWEMLRTLCRTLSILHESNFVHGDVKLYNVLLATSPPMGEAEALAAGRQVRLCDYSLSIWYRVAQHRCMSDEYRAPEVWLGLPWDAGVDIWGLGCVAMEVFLKGRLYIEYGPRPESPEEYIQQIVRFFGPIPEWMLSAAPPEAAGVATAARKVASFLQRVDIAELVDTRPGRVTRLEEQREVELLLDLLRQMLRVDPRTRITAAEALRHPFLQAPGGLGA